VNTSQQKLLKCCVEKVSSKQQLQGIQVPNKLAINSAHFDVATVESPSYPDFVGVGTSPIIVGVAKWIVHIICNSAGKRALAEKQAICELEGK
jgi:hypothetical protein